MQLTRSERHKVVLDGKEFVVSGQATKNSTETHILHFITPAASEGEVYLRFNVRGSGEGNAALYEGPTTSANGTAVTPVCRRRVDPQTALTSVYHTPTVSVNGTLLVELHFGSGLRVGGDTEEQEWILAPATKYLLIITSEAATNDLSWRVELTEKQ